MSRAWIIFASVVTLLAAAWLATKIFGVGLAVVVHPVVSNTPGEHAATYPAGGSVANPLEVIGFAGFAAVGLTVLYLTLGRRKR